MSNSIVQLIVRDAVSPQNMTIDGTYGAVLAYRDGGTRWPLAQVARFLKAGKLIIPITVIGDDPHNAQVADCERYDLTPAGAAKWARQRNDLHGDATIYCNRSTVPAVVDALGDEPAWLHVADWTGREHTPANLDLPSHVKLGLVQYRNVNNVYDESVVLSSAWPLHLWKPEAGAW